jgi:hypothetical protein
MAKRKPQRQQDDAALTYKQLARQRRERKQRRQILVGVSIVSAIVITILLVAMVNELVIEPGQPVATVNGVDVTTDDFQQRVSFERSTIIDQYLQFSDLFGIEQAYQFSGMSLLYRFTETEIQDSYEEFGGQVLDAMIDEVLIHQAAADMGIQVSEEEVSRSLEEQYSYYREGTPTPLPTSTPRPSPTPITSTETIPTPAPTWTPRPTPTVVSEEGYQELYREQLRALDGVGVGEETLRGSLETQLLTGKVRERLMEEVPAEADQVSFEALVFSLPAEANLFLARLEAGESFEDLAEEVRAHPERDGTAQTSSWTPFDELVESYGSAVAEAAFSLEAGEWSELVTTEDGQIMIVYVTGHEVRELSATLLRTKENALYAAWLDQLRASAEIEKHDYWTDRVPQTPSLDYRYLIPTAVPTVEE